MQIPFNGSWWLSIGSATRGSSKNTLMETLNFKWFKNLQEPLHHPIPQWQRCHIFCNTMFLYRVYPILLVIFIAFSIGTCYIFITLFSANTPLSNSGDVNHNYVDASWLKVTERAKETASKMVLTSGEIRNHLSDAVNACDDNDNGRKDIKINAFAD